MHRKKKYHKKQLHAHNILRLEYISRLFLEHRRWLGLSREQVECESGGISRSVIERVESLNDLNLTLKTVFELADFYQIPIHEIFQEIE